MTADAKDKLRFEMSEKRLKKQRQAAGAEDAEIASKEPEAPTDAAAGAPASSSSALSAVPSSSPGLSGGQRAAGVGRWKSSFAGRDHGRRGRPREAS